MSQESKSILVDGLQEAELEVFMVLYVHLLEDQILVVMVIH